MPKRALNKPKREILTLISDKIQNHKEREERYQLQKQEFYLRFGRMPELSESARKECKLQEKDITKLIDMDSRMKIVADIDVPFLKGVFEPWADVVYKKGTEIRSPP